MSAARLGADFFARPTLVAARDLIGRRLVRVRRGRRLAGRIVEVEAYIGSADTACHARRGRTPRNAVMFGPPGRAYVYFTYGMHHMLNVVTEGTGFPAAILVRALEPEEGEECMRRLRARGTRAGAPPPVRSAPSWTAGGPGRLCQALDVDRRLDGEDLGTSRRLFLEEGSPAARRAIERTARIGIDAAAPADRAAPWRFVLRGNPCLSRR